MKNNSAAFKINCPAFQLHFTAFSLKLTATRSSTDKRKSQAPMSHNTLRDCRMKKKHTAKAKGGGLQSAPERHIR